MITDLSRLLATMTPVLGDGEWVFVVLPAGADAAALGALATFREREGLTAICPRRAAEAAGLAFAGPFRLITLEVHSSLEAVGFLAAVTAELARAGISCNAVAAYHHDHLFVPAAAADRALAVLRGLEQRSRPA